MEWVFDYREPVIWLLSVLVLCIVVFAPIGEDRHGI